MKIVAIEERVRRVVMQKIVNGMAFHVTEEFAAEDNAESWIREQEADGYKVVSEKFTDD